MTKHSYHIDKRFIEVRKKDPVSHLEGRSSKIWYDDELKGFGVRLTQNGVAAFILNYRTKAGRERRMTIGRHPNITIAAAKKLAREQIGEITKGADPTEEARQQRNSATVKDLLERYDSRHLSKKRPGTQFEFRRLIEKEINPVLGRMKVNEVRYREIDDFHNAITKRGAPTTANRALAVLSKAFTLAIRWEMTDINPCKGVERNKENRRKRYFSPEEMGRIADALDTLRDKQSANAIRLLIFTGARRMEVLAAQWSEFDLQARMWCKPASRTKQGEDHQIPLSAPALELLVKMKEESDSEYVFPSKPHSSRPHQGDLDNSWKTVRTTAQLEDGRLHDLRHTYASYLVSSGASLPLIGKLLGHSSSLTTERYAHLMPDPQREATEQVAAILDAHMRSEKSDNIEPFPGRNKNA